jgi:hypothetical protein
VGDRKTKNVIIPATIGKISIHQRVKRNLKHITIITCIAGREKQVVPYLITLQELENLREGLRQKGTECGRHLILRNSDKPYVNSKTFMDYAKSAFIPHVMKVRVEKGIQEREAVVLIDHCSCHITSDMMDLLTAGRVRVVTFAPHTTHIFQMINLAYFDHLLRQRVHQDGEDADSSKHLDGISSDRCGILYKPDTVWCCISSRNVKGIPGLRRTLEHRLPLCISDV